MLTQHKHRAFTLIELLVVIGIIAILTALLVPTITNARKRATASAAINVFVNNCEAAKNYYVGGGTGQFNDLDTTGLPGYNTSYQWGGVPQGAGWKIYYVGTGVYSPTGTGSYDAEYILSALTGTQPNGTYIPAYRNLTIGKYRFGTSNPSIFCAINSDASAAIDYFAWDSSAYTKL